MTPGTLAKLDTSMGHRRMPLYKREDTLKHTGFINEYDVCAVTDEAGCQNQVVTSQGTVGWIHKDLLKKI